MDGTATVSPTCVANELRIRLIRNYLNRRGKETKARRKRRHAVTRPPKERSDRWHEKMALKEALWKSLLDQGNGGYDFFSMDERNGKNVITKHKQKYGMERCGEKFEKESTSLENLPKQKIQFFISFLLLQAVTPFSPCGRATRGGPNNSMAFLL